MEFRNFTISISLTRAETLEQIYSTYSEALGILLLIPNKY